MIKEIELFNAQGTSLGVHGILGDQSFYVNGEKKEPVDGVITLASNAKYVLSGVLYGRLEIGADGEEPTDDTHIVLDGVTIINETTDKGIAYLSAAQSMYVTLAKDKKNIIICEHVAEMADKQGACLFSENNMIVQGNGYLSVVNKGGHGLKASELRISGRPHIYVSAIHDGIHGNSKLSIDNGIFHIDGANDAFGTGTTGSIHIFGGDYRCYDIKQKVFDSKVAGMFFGSFSLDTDVEKDNISSGMESDLTTFFADGSVRCYSDEDMTLDETIIEPVEGAYTATTKYVKISGYIEGNVVLPIQSTDVELDNAYISSSKGHAIDYTATSKKVQITSVSGTVNIIEATAGAFNGINSANNVTVECKGGSHLVVMAATGMGIAGSEITLHDSKGVLIVKDCGSVGVQGTDIYIARSASGTDPTKEIVAGALLFFNNNTADISARLSSKGEKGKIHVAGSQLLGIVSADIISVPNGSTAFADLGKGNVYYKITKGYTYGGIGKCYEPYDVIPCGTNSLPLF